MVDVEVTLAKLKVVVPSVYYAIKWKCSIFSGISEWSLPNDDLFCSLNHQFTVDSVSPESKILLRVLQRTEQSPEEPLNESWSAVPLPVPASGVRKATLSLGETELSFSIVVSRTAEAASCSSRKSSLVGSSKNFQESSPVRKASQSKSVRKSSLSPTQTSTPLSRRRSSMGAKSALVESASAAGGVHSASKPNLPFTVEELTKIFRAFSDLSDPSEAVPLPAFGTMVSETLGRDVPSDKMLELIAVLDNDNSGTVTRMELARKIKLLSEETGEVLAELCFEFFLSDSSMRKRDLRLSEQDVFDMVDDMIAVLTYRSVTSREPEVLRIRDDVMKKYGQDGFIDFDQFKRLVQDPQYKYLLKYWAYLIDYKEETERICTMGALDIPWFPSFLTPDSCSREVPKMEEEEEELVEEEQSKSCTLL
eukprot:NODE_1856_length_1379_cov_16.860150_g1679_i0.p1 GENE.NODE_1856_length_1379_cov_16.860150_g1679_i0~~NODE_1856_length_1379_cov_16.860150_g1679_i0.p1  ORF type:complete len:422 (-),score=79.58 NODE_1856_length_1379_cov_16.860150_g1679_i0:56-1321(-)